GQRPGRRVDRAVADGDGSGLLLVQLHRAPGARDAVREGDRLRGAEVDGGAGLAGHGRIRRVRRCVRARESECLVARVAGGGVAGEGGDRAWKGGRDRDVGRRGVEAGDRVAVGVDRGQRVRAGERDRVDLRRGGGEGERVEGGVDDRDGKDGGLADRAVGDGQIGGL